MFSKRLIRVTRTLAFRLTLSYAGIFTISTCLAFLLFYLLITARIREQIDQELIDQLNRFSSLLTVEDLETVQRVAVIESRASGVKKLFFRLLYPNGVVFSSSNMSYWKNIGISRQAVQQLSRGSTRVLETITISGRRDKIRILYGSVGPGIVLQLGQSMENHTRFLEAFRRIFAATLGLLLVFAVLVGVFMARHALSGVATVTRTARDIAAGTLDRRVPAKPGGDEIDQLAHTFNQMLDRIQRLVTGIGEMSDNIAHDLKSPVTRIRGMAEVALSTQAGVDDLKGMAASTIEECDGLLDMINTMLVISRTEAGAGDFHPTAMDLAALIRQACDLFEPLAEDGGIDLTCTVPAEYRFVGDMRLIQRLITNLLDNAIKYTATGGTVAVTLTPRPAGGLELSVGDSGIGISPKDMDQIFERFYRCDQSRSQPGIGLGLSLARTIARAHKGDIRVQSRPGRGSTFTVNLPPTSDT